MIFVLGKGSILNEEKLQDLPEPVSCEIMEAAEILAIPGKQLLSLMETDARLLHFLFFSQSHKVRRLYRQLKNTTNATRGKRWQPNCGSWHVMTGKGGGRCPYLPETHRDPDRGYAGNKKGDSFPPAQSSGGTFLVRYDKNTFVIPEPDALNRYFKE